MARSFGLILANRAVVLGAVKVPDLVDLTVAAERSASSMPCGPATVSWPSRASSR